MAEAPASALREAVGFRTIDQLAVRCGHYCWLENQLFACTGRWASAPAAAGPTTVPTSSVALDAEVRVRFSAMSSWHGFVTGQWGDRLPVRAGVDAAALIVPPSVEMAEVFDQLGTAPGLRAVLGALADPVLPALRRAYDHEATLGAAASEWPVLSLLDLVGPALPREIEAARELSERAAPDAAEADKVTEVRRRLQLLLKANDGIFPAVSAS